MDRNERDDKDDRTTVDERTEVDRVNRANPCLCRDREVPDVRESDRGDRETRVVACDSWFAVCHSSFILPSLDSLGLSLSPFLLHNDGSGRGTVWVRRDEGYIPVSWVCDEVALDEGVGSVHGVAVVDNHGGIDTEFGGTEGVDANVLVIGVWVHVHVEEID